MKYAKVKEKQSLLDSLTSCGDNIIVNRKITKKVGSEAALILAELISEYVLWESKNMLTKDGYFFCTEDKLYECTGWKYSKQRSNIDKLIDANLIKVENRGMPLKRYFKLNIKNIIKNYKGE